MLQLRRLGGWRHFGIAALALTLAGCTFYPMGLNKAQWEALTPAQQADYRARQYAIDAEQQRAAEARRLEEERAAAEARARAAAELAERYRHARYGDIVTVTIRDGVVAFYGKRQPFEPVSFDILRGETRPVTFTRQGRSHDMTEIEMRLSDDGDTFYFDAPSRRRIVIANDGWEHGRTFSDFPEIRGDDGHSEALGISIRVKFKPLPHGSR